MKLAEALANEHGRVSIMFGVRPWNKGWYVHATFHDGSDGIEYDGCDVGTVRYLGEKLIQAPGEAEHKKALEKAERMAAIIEASK